MSPAVADRVPPRSTNRAAIEWTAAAGFVAAAAIYAALIVARGALPLPRPRLSLIAAGLLVVAGALRKDVFMLVAFAAGAVGLLMLTASGEATAAIVAAAILAACAEIGAGVRRAAGADAAGSLVERIALDLPLGVAAVGLSVFVLGACRILHAATVAAVLAAAVFVSFRTRRAAARPSPPDRPRPARLPERFLLRTAIAGAAILQLAGAIPPETRYDALNYHLPVPRDWLLAHALAPLSYWHGNFAHLAEAFFAAPLAFGGAAAVKLVVVGLTLAVFASTFVLGRDLYGARAALWAAAFVASIPIFAKLAWTAGADSIVVLFGTAAVVCGCRILSRPEARGEPLLFGVFAGAAVGTKLNAAYFVAIPSIVLLAQAARRKVPVRGLLLAAGAMAIVGLPWFAMTWRFTGNPVFPFFNQWFRSPFAGPGNGLGIAKFFGIGTSPSAWVRLPWALTAHTRRFGEITRDGEIGPLLIFLPMVLATPFAVVDRRRATIAATAVGYTVCWTATLQYARYLTLAFPLFAVLIAGTAASFGDRAPLRIALAALVAGMLLQTGFLFGMVDRAEWQVAFGARSPDEYLHGRFPALDCFREVSRAAGPGDRVAATGRDGVRYLIDPPVDTFTESLPFAAAIRPLRDRALRDALWSRGNRFLLLKKKEGRGSAPFAEPEFLARFAEPLCATTGFAAFRLKPPGSEDRDGASP